MEHSYRIQVAIVVRYNIRSDNDNIESTARSEFEKIRADIDYLGHVGAEVTAAELVIERIADDEQYPVQDNSRNLHIV